MSESNQVTSFPVDPNLDFANQALAATATNTYTFRYDSSVEGGVKVEHISDGFREFLGYDPRKYAELANPLSVVHEEDIPILKAKSEANQRGEGTIATARVLAAGGEIKWIKIVSIPRKEADGTLRIFNATFDITAEQRALENTRRLDSLFSAAKDAVIVKDLEGVILMWNDAAETIFGYTAEEATGRPIQLIIPPEKRVEETAIMRSMLNGVSTDILRTERMRKNGDRFPAAVRVTPFRDASGVLRGATSVTIDLSEVESKRSELDAESKNLAREVSGLRRSNEDLAEFASVASHDLQEPLRKIETFMGRIESRLADKMGERERDYFARALSAVGRMRGMIEKLLSLSRVERRRLVIEPTSIARLVEEAKEDLSEAIERSGAKIETSELPTIEGDATALRQLFTNLIANAIKFRREGVEPRVSVTAKRSDIDDPPVWVVEIEDNGVGFDNQYRERIFEAFRRLHSRERFEGSGVGLALCRKIVERHGGAIVAEGQENQGAKFTVALPERQIEERR
ncbi:MAG: PAS domain S-box protein [Ignavibacteriales bacterium]|nr:PAS domain S-box protein [Ignavibacteriales bacterium]